MGVDPADGAIYVATHDGLFRTGPSGAGPLQPAGTTGRDLMGFTITGPRAFLSSGHPGPDEQIANPLGLIASTDSGASWTTLSLAGEVDFHALETSLGTVYGYDATNQLLQVSADGGRSWQPRAPLAALDIAVDPADPAQVLATVSGGVAASSDGGRSFGRAAGPAMAYLSWAPDGAVFGLGSDATLYTRIPGADWRQLGVVPGGRAQALTALGGGQLLIATAGGIYRSGDGGRTVAALT